MRSYIKIYGPPVFEAIKALQEIAIPIEEVCIMDTIWESGGADVAIDIGVPVATERASPGLGFSASAVEQYFVQNFGSISKARCENIISKSGQSVGEYDFYYEWFGEPNQTQLTGLIQKIDEALKPLGCRYTITTKDE
jgi:hypothetical protein